MKWVSESVSHLACHIKRKTLATILWCLPRKLRKLAPPPLYETHHLAFNKAPSLNPAL